MQIGIRGKGTGQAASFVNCRSPASSAPASPPTRLPPPPPNAHTPTCATYTQTRARVPDTRPSSAHLGVGTAGRKLGQRGCDQRRALGRDDRLHGAQVQKASAARRVQLGKHVIERGRGGRRAGRRLQAAGGTGACGCVGHARHARRVCWSRQAEAGDEGSRANNTRAAPPLSIPEAVSARTSNIALHSATVRGAAPGAAAPPHAAAAPPLPHAADAPFADGSSILQCTCEASHAGF